MHDKNAWKLKIKEKGRVIWSYRPLERKTLQKDQRKMTKIWLDALTDRIEREKVFETFEKCLNTWKQRFKKKKKTLYTTLDWSKNRFDRSKMLWLIQHQSSTNRNRQKLTKILIAISIGWKTGLINQNSRKKKLKIKANLCRNSSKHWLLWIKCMSMRWSAFHTCFEPSFSKIKIFNQFPYILKYQTCFAQNLRDFQTWLAEPKSHTITYTKFRKE